MADELKVFWGLWAFWTHHKKGLVWTVTDKGNAFIQLCIGILFGVAQPCFERLVAHILGWLHYPCSTARNKHSDGNSTDENTPLVNSAQVKKSKWHSCCCGAETCTVHCSQAAIAKILSWGTIVLGIAYTVAGSFVNSVPADTSVRSNSERCGVYGLRTDALSAAQDEEQIFQGQKETRAAQYARACYSPDSIIDPSLCNIFESKVLPTVDFSAGEQCPFTNAEYCDQSGDGYNAVRFSTGKVGSVEIGSNTDASVQFNRTTICVPLNINQGFVRKSSPQVGHWVYDLGPVSSDEYSSPYTFTQYGDPFTWDVRSYTISTYEHVYSKPDSDNYWKPIDGLTIRDTLSINHTQPHSLTIIFINSCRIFYKSGSRDPVFPADRPWSRNPSLWVNHDSRARPLACIDWKEICNRHGCGAPEPANARSRDYNFASFSLAKSSIYEAIQYRGASALDAQDKIKDDTSLALPNTQWINESWALFNTSLARIQYDAFDIANGTGWELRRYEPKLSDEKKMCNFYVFPIPRGYANIRVFPTLGILAIPLVLYFCGRKTNEEFGEKFKETEYFEDNKLIVIEWVIWCLWQKCKALFRKEPKTSEEDPPDAAFHPASPVAPTVTSGSVGATYGATTPSNAPSTINEVSTGASPPQSGNDQHTGGNNLVDPATEDRRLSMSTNPEVS